MGVTPATVTLKASRGYFKRESYEITVFKGSKAIAVTQLTSKLDKWYYGNILVGGFIGSLIVDPLTGSMYSLPKEVHVGPAAVSLKHSLVVREYSVLTTEEKEQLIVLN